MDNTNNEIIFLPWANLTSTVHIGDVSFIPKQIFLTEISRTDPDIHEHLSAFFDRYVDHDGLPTRTIVVVKSGTNTLSPFTETDRNEINKAINILFFSIFFPQLNMRIGGNNFTYPVCNSAVYQSEMYPFSPGNKDHFIPSANTIHVGYTFDKLSFEIPWSIKYNQGQPDTKIIDRFRSLSLITTPDTRIYRALEWFKLAHSNDITWETRVVMMATAFEIFFDIPYVGKAQAFAYQVDKCIANTSFITDTRQHKKEKIECSRAGCWAWDFYKLRNDIVHGDLVASEKQFFHQWITQLDVADLVFSLSIIRLLDSPDVSERIFHFIYSSVFETLGWLKSSGL